MIREFYDLTAEEREDHRKKYGGYNFFPPGWKQISEEEFSKSNFFLYTPVMVEHRQMMRVMGGKDITGPCVSATLMFMHDNTGYATVSDYWNGKVRFYKFGCKHEYADWETTKKELDKRKITLYSHDHASYCAKCGYLSVVDSSD